MPKTSGRVRGLGAAQRDQQAEVTDQIDHRKAERDRLVLLQADRELNNRGKREQNEKNDGGQMRIAATIRPPPRNRADEGDNSGGDRDQLEDRFRPAPRPPLGSVPLPTGVLRMMISAVLMHRVTSFMVSR